MNLLRAIEFKVGLMVLSVAGLIAYMSLQVSDNPTFFGRSTEAYFILPDAGGLVKNSAVKTAGIGVGIIKNITLQDGQARIEISLRPDVTLRTTAQVRVRSQGILGDRFVDITPGSSTDPVLEKGGQVTAVNDTGSMESVVSSIADTAKSLKQTIDIVQESIANTGENKHVLGRIVLNIEKLTTDIAQLTGDNKDKINEIVDQIHGITSNLDELLGDETEQGIKNQLKRSVTRLDSSLKNIDEITGKINRGEGSIGKLVNDDTTVEELNTAIDGINGFLDTAGKTQTGLDFNSQYLGAIGGSKTAVGVRLQPGMDRYYYLGIVDDSAGVTKETITKTTSSGTTTEINEQKTFLRDYKFNLQFAKNFYDFTVRGGLIESSGGVGFDYHLFNQRLKLTLEAFSFSKLNLRPQIQFNVYRGIYVVGGMNDALNRNAKQSAYLGAGLFITNDDIKALIGSVPLPK